MTIDRPTHSQSWDRIGPLRPTLRNGVEVRRRVFHRRRGYILHDPSANQFFRLDPVSYHFVALLDGARTVEEAWESTSERYQDRAPTQNEVVGLLSQMYQSNLISLDSNVDSETLFKRMKKREAERTKRQAMNFLFLKISVFDPAPIIDFLLPFTRWAIGPLGLALWCVLIVVACAQVFPQWGTFVSSVSNILERDNWIWLMIVFAVIKAIHEFAHGTFCRRFGGEVHDMGFMLLVLYPVPYCDATASWGLKTRYQRAAVGFAGIVVELGISAICAILWANLQDGFLKQMCFNIIFISGVASLAFNANPLLRYDGYYVLSDLLDIPNLAQRANKHVQYWAQRVLFGLPNLRPATHLKSEAGWLTFYFVASWAYRALVYIAIIWFLSDRYFGLGVVLSVLAVVTMIVVPLGKFSHWLVTSPQLLDIRARAYGVSLGIAATLIVLVGFIPIPDRYRVEGVVESPQRLELVMQSEAFVEQVLAHDGESVKKGQTIATARNPSLESVRQDFIMQRAEAEIMRANAVSKDRGLVATIDARIRAIDERIAETDRRLAQLTVISPIDGELAAPALESLRGAFVNRGTILGSIVQRNSLRVVARLEQTQPSAVFRTSDVQKIEVRTFARPDLTLSGKIERLFPVAHAVNPNVPGLVPDKPNPGKIVTDRSDQRLNIPPTQSEFKAWVSLPEEIGQNLIPGQRAMVRFTLPPKTLFEQALKIVLQSVSSRVAR